jgi:hypothetical protein
MQKSVGIGLSPSHESVKVSSAMKEAIGLILHALINLLFSGAPQQTFELRLKT